MSFRIFPTSRFQREYKKLPERIKPKVKERLALFNANPFDDMLNTHKLSGKLKHLGAFSIDYDHRIVFEIDGKKIYLKAIGRHSIYDRFQ